MEKADLIRKKIQAELPQIEIRFESDQLLQYGRDAYQHFEARPSCIAFPKDQAEIQALVEFANRHDFPLVPSGGRTGLSGAATATQQEIIVSFDRMNAILDFQESEGMVQVQAGVIIQELQKFAESKGLYYPIEYAATGSSQVGGNIATNAGGIQVLRYGLTRNWVTGLKVITGKGDFLNLNQGLIKNATGYDLRHLFIGSEGTLGLITEATIQLTSPPASASTFLFGLDGLEKLTALLPWFRQRVKLIAFEVFSDIALNYALEESDIRFGLKSRYPFYALVEFDQLADLAAPSEKEARETKILEEITESELIREGTLAWDRMDRANLWAHRELIPVGLNKHAPYKSDIAVRINRIPEFLKDLTLLLEKHPDSILAWFGHLGDGNLHLNFPKPIGTDPADFQKTSTKTMEEVFALVKKYEGSISAEHGVGMSKKPYLSYSRSAAEINYFKALKQVFDPKNILNPGKIMDL